MADQKISDLGDGGLPLGTDEFVVARGTTNNKIAWSSMSAAGGGPAIAASNTTYTSGTVVFTGSNLTVSTNGQTVILSAQAQSVQTQNAVDVTLSGNTAGALALISSGTMTIAGGNNITLSQAGNAITISGPNVAGAQTGISAIANSETTYTSGTVSLLESGAITILSTTGQQYVFSVDPQSVQPETQTFIAGVSASDTLYTSGNVRISGSNAATVKSGTGQLVIIDVPVQSTQVETQTFIGGLIGSDATYTSGTVRISGVGGGVTVNSNTGQRIDISVAAPVAQSAQTGISGIANSQTTYTSGTVSLSELGAITIRSTTGNQYQFSVAAQSVQPETQTFIGGVGNSQTTYTSGTVNLSVVAGQLTIRSTTGNAFQFSVSQSVQAETQTAISGIANSQTTYTSGTVSLSELGAITIRSTTGNQFQFSVAAQTAQTGISGIANSQTTYTSGTVSLSELGAITIRSTTGNQYQFSVNSQTVQTQSFLSGGMSTGGNTSGDTGYVTGRLNFAGGNNITLSGSTNAGSMTITISAPNLGAGAMSAGVSTGGNTAGATGITGTQLVLVGTGPISLSQTTGANGGTVSINAPATSSLSATGAVSISVNASTISIGAPTQTNQSGNVYASSNTFGTSSGTFDARTISIAGSGGVSVAASNSGWVISAPSPQTAAEWENFPQMQASLFTHVSGVSKTPFYWPENLPQGIKPANIAFRVSLVTASTDLSMSVHFGVYTFVNSTSLALLGSGSDAFAVGNASSVSFSGQRNLILTSPGTVAAISSLTPGNYVFGVMFSAAATASMNASIYAASVAAGRALGGIYPGTGNVSTGTSQGIAPLYGRGSSTVNVMPANVGATDLINQGSGASAPMKPWIFIRS